MTRETRKATLRPIGSGTLHTDPTCRDARQESLREWAVSRRGVREPGRDEPTSTRTRRSPAPRR